MAINIASATTLLSSSILLLLITSCYSTGFGLPASTGNVLQGGEQLMAGKSLSIGNYKFTMQKDCNLVLYENHKAIWDSDTQGMGNNCSLVMNTNGELYIFSELDEPVWRTETGGKYGIYALVLTPYGNVVVNSKPIWSTGLTQRQSKSISAISQNP